MPTCTYSSQQKDPYMQTLADIIEQIDRIDPVAYARTCNYLDGAVTCLSSYISHGVISTPFVAKRLLKRYSRQECEKLFSEFAWREYFQFQWQDLGDSIFTDIRQPQSSAEAELPSKALLNADSGIEVVDKSIQALLETGYIHNHARMWLAFMHCHVAKTHWYQPAKWLYYHLLDGDLASNYLSWQWVAGTFSNKAYIANQANLNKYSNTHQQGTFLDQDYASIATMKMPSTLRGRQKLQLASALPDPDFDLASCSQGTTLCYSIWNLDANWHANTQANRILLIEPALFDRFPISPKRWQFILHWAHQIPQLQIFVGSFAQLRLALPSNDFVYREHPTCVHWRGKQETRPFLFPTPEQPIKGYFPFYKAVKDKLQC